MAVSSPCTGLKGASLALCKPSYTFCPPMNTQATRVLTAMCVPNGTWLHIHDGTPWGTAALMHDLTRPSHARSASCGRTLPTASSGALAATPLVRSPVSPHHATAPAQQPRCSGRLRAAPHQPVPNGARQPAPPSQRCPRVVHLAFTSSSQCCSQSVIGTFPTTCRQPAAAAVAHTITHPTTSACGSCHLGPALDT